ncbi:MAG: hypothetical protein ACAF41_30835 [Leptolyngbya sp. BL-A-14]
MSDLTTGPIQTYIGESTLLSPTTSLNPDAGSVSVTLTDSNLWLVDPTKLNGQTSDPATQFTLMDLQTKYQTTVPFDNVNFNATTLAPAALTSSESSYLQTNLPQGSALMLASVTGGTQLGSDGMSLTSTGSGGGDTGGASSGGASGSLSGGGGGGGGGSSSGGGGGGSSGGGATSGSSSNATPVGSSTQTGIATTQVTPSPQATVSPQAPVPVPFEVSPTIGLLFVLFLFSHKFLLKRMAFKPIGIRVTSLICR